MKVKQCMDRQPLIEEHETKMKILKKEGIIC